MTRETKIGLLVGLAFIIVIGILLSDHMTSTTQPPTAELAEAAPNVRESVTTPASANPAPGAVTRVSPITPANAVLTQQELRPPVPAGPAVARVEIGGPAGHAGSPIAIRQSGPPVVVQQQPQQHAGNAGLPVQVSDAATPSDDMSDLERWAERQGVSANPTPAAPVALAAAAKREYVVQSGDSLSKIAARFLGSASKANIDALIRANPSLQKNPDIVVVGRKYVIPDAPTAAAAQQQPQQPAVVNTGRTSDIPGTVPVQPRGGGVAARPVPVSELVETIPPTTPAQGGGTWYVVKENDTLWAIARDQVGSANAWTQIRDMNRDVLKGGETVQPNMRLRLPAKSVASAN